MTSTRTTTRALPGDVSTRAVLVAMALAGLVSGTGRAQSPRPDPGLVPAVMNGLAAWGFSGAVLVAREGNIRFEGGFGPADTSGRVVTTQTRFDVASLAKLVTATLAFSLAADGLVDLDQPIARLIAGVPPDKATLTPLHLLGHTSGLPRELVEDFVPVSRDSLIGLALHAKLHFPPGGGVHYSNTGYALLAAWLELATGRPFDELVRERIFRVAGMTSTGFQGAIPGSAPVAATRTIPLRGQSPREWPRTWGNRGSGGVVSTVGDWYRLLSALLHDRFGAGVLARMADPAGPARGYGIEAERTASGLRFSHSGLWYGFTSYFVVSPDSSMVVVFSNGPGPGEHPARTAADLLTRALAGDATAVPPAVVPDAPKLAPGLAGSYRIDSSATVTLVAAEHGFSARPEGQAAWNLVGWNDPAAAGDLVRRLASYTADILEGVGRGDFTRLEATAPAERAARYRRMLPAIWRERTDSLGRLVRVRVLGTGPPVAADGLLETRARLEFARGAEEVVLVWSPDGVLQGLINENPPLRNPQLDFRLTPDGSYVSWNPAIGESVRLRLRGTDAGIEISRPGGPGKASLSRLIRTHRDRRPAAG